MSLVLLPECPAATHQLSPFDSAANAIASLHQEIIANARMGIERAIEVGRQLEEVKRRIPHGQFGRFVEERLPFTPRTARNYIRLFRNRERLKTENISDLAEAYRLLGDRVEDKSAVRKCSQATAPPAKASGKFEAVQQAWRKLPEDQRPPDTIYADS
jgi:hypothetical protein